MPRLAAAVVIACAGGWGCFNPNPPTGLSCDPAIGCPEGEICVAGECVRDAPPDGGALACEWPSPPALIDPCALPEPSGPRDLGGAGPGMLTYDTGTDMLSDGTGALGGVVAEAVGGRMVRVVIGTSIDVSGGLRVVGPLPLVLLSYSDIVVSGEIDVSSRARFTAGAGANPDDCLAAKPGGGPITGPSSGGGGGGFGGIGGAGGGAGSEAGGPGGAPLSPTLHGGCPGASGGNSTSAGGAGGGAVYLTAQTLIAIDGVIGAGGAGGSGGEGDGIGGGGGGSGGYIGVDAPDVLLDAGGRLAANGGGGGGGGLSPNGVGKNGDVSAARALGGDGGNGNNNGGGRGGAGDVLDGEDGGESMMTPADGGGGGGAVGVIQVFDNGVGVIDLSGLVSPPPS